MTTDTPRTDAEEYTQDDSNPPEKLGLVDAGFARQLERELNIANARILQLKEAGGALCQQLKDERSDWSDWTEQTREAIEKWTNVL